MLLNDFLAASSHELKFSDYLSVASRSAAETGFAPLKISVLRNFTFEMTASVLAGEFMRLGFHPEIKLGGFDTIMQDVFDEGSELYSFAPDFILAFQWLDTLSPRLSDGFAGLSAEQVEQEVSRIISDSASAISAIRKQSNAHILINNFPLPYAPSLGVLDSQSNAGQAGTIRLINDLLMELASNNQNVHIIDLMGVSARMGSSDFFDVRQWHIARQPFGSGAILSVAQEVAKIARALLGKTKKCLVLDCDNTLWGGVVGEDGVDGIVIGDSYPGSMYLQLQKEILDLHARGVILAVCSKNNEADVLDVFKNHPAMILREEHISCWTVNWTEKPVNLKSIADELNIGVDSLVFVDDSAYEIGFVRQNLPQVSSILLPEDRTQSYGLLANCGLFDTLALTAEDKKRSETYKTNRDRKKLEGETSSLEEYLTSLGIVMSFREPSNAEVARVAQLSQKTNQFNLTTKRYSEDDVLGYMESPHSAVYLMAARDRFSDLGVVGVAVVKFQDEDAELDTFLLSCRALGRGLEDAFLSSVICEIKEQKGPVKFIGRYIKTDKNELCRELYIKNGFTEINNAEGCYALEAKNKPAIPEWISVERE